MINTRIEGRVALITLNRPEARNALNAQIREDLIVALSTFELMDEIGCIVITGEGKCFAAGADIKELATRTAEQQREFISPPHMYETIQELKKPVIAAINGHALGAGLELATACDIRIAHPDAKLGQPEINLAIIPGGGGTQRLARLIGAGQAARMIFTGVAVVAKDAPVGLVDELSGNPVQSAIELASVIANQDPFALQQAKQALGSAHNDDYRAEIDAFMKCFGRDEMHERIQQFLQ